jgi:sugar lactone lactonase YvrE
VDASGTQASLSAPQGVAFSPDSSFLVFAENVGHRIRKFDFATAQVTTLAGVGTPSFADGPGSLACFSSPVGVAIDPTGAFVLIADVGNHRIRMLVLATRVVSTLAGSAASGFADGAGPVSTFAHPYGITISSDASFALVADTTGNRLRRISLASSHVSTLAGTGGATWTDGAGGLAAFYAPTAVAISGDGSFALVADNANRRVRRVQLAAPCGLGSFCPAVASAPTACAAGAFCNATGMTAESAQIVCPAGSYCALASAAPTACAANFYCNATGASSANAQVACQAGTYCAAGSTMPSVCTAGYFCARMSFNRFGAVDRASTSFATRLVQFWFACSTPWPSFLPR